MPRGRPKGIEVKVDKELFLIITAMKRDSVVNKAIRRYAKAFIGEEKWKKLEEELSM